MAPKTVLIKVKKKNIRELRNSKNEAWEQIELAQILHKKKKQS